MSTIEEFQAEASKAFESDAGLNVITTITTSRHFPKPEFSVVIRDADGNVFGGSASTERDAINNCKSRRAQAQQNKIEAARLLLEANGHTVK